MIAVLSATLLAGIKDDYKTLEQGGNLNGVDRNRLVVVEKWQKKAKQDPDFKVSILPSKITSLNSINISSESDFKENNQDLWVNVERYVTGKIYNQGGKNKVNNLHKESQIKAERQLL